MRKTLATIIGAMALFCICSADDCTPTQTADRQQTVQQEQILKEGNAQVGMPNIKNFRERKLLKQILEMRDQDGLVTYTYTIDLQGHLHFFCDSFGYPIPYATEYTSPMRPAHSDETYEQGNISVPQADPNGLFSPVSADGTWVVCKDPNSNKSGVVYVEPRVTCSPFPLPNVK